ncbi:lysophosphatidylserine lipase ABHD12 isoform X2 [Bacillus rossius redtenbacheri]|uniref:lysophosphatidylserine lipase ABHD12 isoform X2 n=1 Tax=Bacillus rossius redtenbacheri TaxID=93214 RepID=UPI002FDEF48E
MIWLRKRRFIRRISLWALKTTLCIFLVLFVIIPVVFKYTYPLQRSVIFLNFVNYPWNTDLKNPSKFGLNGIRNFYIKTEDNIEIGVWHILPASLRNSSREKNNSFYEDALASDKPVVLYLHGNSGSRASGHRVELYQLLSNLGYHVIAIDYRSYGDSTNVAPSEIGVVNDAMTAYKWTIQRSKGAPFFVWGHSLGTGVASHMLDLLSRQGIHANGLVLEAPFTNLRDELQLHPFANLFRHLPWFEYCIVDPIGYNQLLFENDKHLKKVHCRILILHAEDDRIIPFKLGKALFNKLSLEHPTGVKLVQFDKKNGLGHKWICRAPELPAVLKQFVKGEMK